MATITGFTSARMLAIENASVVDGEVVGDNLILTRYDNTTIDAGSVRGPTGSPGVTEAELDTFMEDHLPIGSSVDYVGTSSPSSKWLTMAGQTITNGQTLYPTFWGRIPTSWKSGSSIIMPDTRKKVFVGYDATDSDFDAIGKTGGAKTHTLTKAQLPAEPLTINPPNTAVTIVDPGHIHNLYTWIAAAPGTSTTTPAPLVGEQDVYIAPHTTGITASVDIAEFNSSNLGSGQAHNNLQPYITFLKIVKVL